MTQHTHPAMRLTTRIYSALTRGNPSRRDPATREEPDPPIYSYLDLSTGHTRLGELETLLAITAGSAGPRTIRHEWGAWVNVPTDDDEDGQETLAAISEDCPHITACLRYARAHGCWWINFDADAATVGALAEFDHSHELAQRRAETAR
jgi:hypothetical protein